MRLHWPRSLFARLALLLCLGVAVAQGLSFWLTMRERNEATTNMMMGYIEREVTTSVALLDALPAAQRAEWLPRLARRSYEFRLEECDESLPHLDVLEANAVRSFEEGVGKQYKLTVHQIIGEHERYQVHLRLSDGMPLTIDFRPMRNVPMSPWFGALMVAQLAVFALCCWLAVRLATRPLQQLALAADALGPDMQGAHLPENGPSEVARAARAFNAMQQRIAGYMAERIHPCLDFARPADTDNAHALAGRHDGRRSAAGEAAAGLAGHGATGEGRCCLCAHPARHFGGGDAHRP